MVLLPTEMLVYVRSRSPRLDKCTIAPQVVATRSYAHEVEVVVTWLVTSHTITKTDLQLVEIFDVSHEVLTLDVPATRYRREHTPLSEQWISFRTELRRTLETYRSTEEVTLIVVVHYTSKERSQFIFVLVATHISIGISTFFLTFTHTHVVVEEVIQWELRVVCIEALAQTSLVRLTEHRLESVIIPLTNVMESILHHLLGIRAIRLVSYTTLTLNRTESRSLVFTIPIVVVLNRIERRELQSIDDIQCSTYTTDDNLVLSIVGSLHDIRNWVPRVEVIRLVEATILVEFRIIRVDRHSWVLTNSLVQVIVVSPCFFYRSIREVVCQLQFLVESLLVSRKTSIDLLEVRVNYHTLEATIASRSTEVEVLSTTRDRYVVRMRNWGASDSLHPIGRSTHIGTTTSSHHICAVLISGQYAWSICHYSSIHATIVLSVELTILRTTFGSNEDDTSVRTCTINSRSRTVFQYVDRLNVAWKYRRKVTTRHTVDNVERRSRTRE